jgi:prevent-host-death family protein
VRVTSTQFQQNVGRYQDAAMHAPVVITKHNRPHTVLVSAVLFDVLTKGGIARRVEELDDDTLRAIAAASVPEDLAAPDGLLKDWGP